MASFDLTSVTTLTFDCYGTLIDWEAGTIEALRPLLIRHGIVLSDDEIIATCQELEDELREPPYKSYKAVLSGVVAGFGRRFSFPVEPTEQNLLAGSVASWRPFPDTVETLRALRRRYRLAIISNIDDDMFAVSVPKLGTWFDQIVTSEQARCYKPDLPIFEEALRRLTAAPATVAHVAEGATEVQPARRLGCATVWIRRNGRSAKLLTEVPDVQVPDMRSLLTTLGVNG
ncbi:HAD family hydrolase [Rhodopila sp.]|uniref:HAD family hydrolase n=1 Tax=Rhodopila sp. TaxID=2480087 RepID=UPI003D110275